MEVFVPSRVNIIINDNSTIKLKFNSNSNYSQKHTKRSIELESIFVPKALNFNEIKTCFSFWNAYLYWFLNWWNVKFKCWFIPILFLLVWLVGFKNAVSWLVGTIFTITIIFLCIYRFRLRKFKIKSKLIPSLSIWWSVSSDISSPTHSYQWNILC